MKPTPAGQTISLAAELGDQCETPDPPIVVGNLLAEVYFIRIFNSNLLFHRPSFSDEYAQGRVKDYVYLSVFAVASLFFRDPSFLFVGRTAGSNQSIYESGKDWAERASCRALQHADKEDLSVIQACENLALYWWAVKEARRAYLHSMTSYTVCQMLGLERMASKPKDWSQLRYELARRCFWACWIKQCVRDTPYVALVQVNSVPEIPLPCNDYIFDQLDPFTSPVAPRRVFVSDAPHSVHAHGSQTAASVRVYSIWLEVKAAIRRRNSNQMSLDFHDISELDAKIRRIDVLISNLQSISGLPLTHDSTFTRILQLFCSYHGCLVLLHAFVCLSSSGRVTNGTVSPFALEVAAKSMLTASTSITQCIHSILARRVDVTRISTFVGHCAFMCGVIHLILHQLTKHEPFAVQVQVSLNLLKLLSDSWPVLLRRYIELNYFAVPFLDVYATLPTYDPERQIAEQQEMCRIGVLALTQPPAAMGGTVPATLRSLPVDACYTTNSPTAIDSVSPGTDQTTHQSPDVNQASWETPPLPDNQISSVDAGTQQPGGKNLLGLSTQCDLLNLAFTDFLESESSMTEFQAGLYHMD